MGCPANLKHLFAHTQLFTDAQHYVLVHFPPTHVQLAQALCAQSSSAHFTTWILDKDEITCIVPQSVWGVYDPKPVGARSSLPYRLITFDIVLDFDVVGYLAVVSALLAEANVSIIAISAFSRDHIFVESEDFDRAWGILNAFLKSCC